MQMASGDEEFLGSLSAAPSHVSPAQVPRAPGNSTFAVTFRVFY